MTDFELNQTVSTPNGPGFFQAHTWANQADANINNPPDAVLIRHPKKPAQEINLELCAAVWSKTGRDGWLAVYKLTDNIEVMK